MSQPQPSRYPEPAFTSVEPLALVGGDDVLRTGDNPVGRTVAELEVLLAPLLVGQTSAMQDEARRWPLGRTMAFILASCGLFWAGAAFAVWSWL